MTYNIHPLFVHFPIALLCVYSLIKVLPFERWFPSVSWKHIERAVLFGGVVGAFLSLSTGEIAEHLVNPDNALVETHAFFATLSTWLYAALLAGEILVLFRERVMAKVQIAPLNTLLVYVQKVSTHPTLSKILAVLALGALVITGVLGGVMVYGVSADPMAGVVMTLLGLTL